MNESASSSQQLRNRKFRYTPGIPTFTRLDFTLWGLVNTIAFMLFSFLVQATLNTVHPDWTIVYGKVTSVTTGFKLTRIVEYAYQVSGRNYTGKETFQVQGYFISAGQPAVIRVNPASPTNAVLQTGFGPVTVLWSLLAALSALIAYCSFSMAIKPPKMQSDK